MDEMLSRGEDSVGMTDLQFYAAERDHWSKREQELLRQIDALRGNASACCGEGMTDNQSRRFEELIRENEILHCKLRKADSEGMTDYQFKHVLDLQNENAALRKELAALKNGPDNEGFNK